MCAGRLFHDRVWSHFSSFSGRILLFFFIFIVHLPTITSFTIFQQRAIMSIEIAAFTLSMWVLPVAVACHGCSSNNNKERKTLLSMASKIKLEDDETYNDRAKQYNDDSIEVTTDQSTAWSSYNCSLVCY